jgi:hypothetical protein
MLKDIVEVRPLEGYRLSLRFEDGIERVVDVSQLISFSGVFEPLKDPGEFRRVRVNPELGSIEWPNGADLDPDVLYAQTTADALKSRDCSGAA